VYSLATFDDGTGEALFVGGAVMSVAGDTPAKGVAKWTGTRWAQIAPLERGGTVNALAVYDDGNGAKLHTGTALGVVSAWNGSAWSDLPSLRGGGSVQALTVFDDGTGAALYAAGSFGGVGSREGSHVARWDGKKWSPVGSESSFECVWSLTVFDDGKGPALYAGGWLASGDRRVGRVAKWNGTEWTSVGPELNGTVFALRSSGKDGAAQKLYIGGKFTSTGSHLANHIAQWDGTQWMPVGAGVDFEVRAIATLHRPSGPLLFAGGSSEQSGPARKEGCVSQWDGKTWSPTVSPAPKSVLALATFNAGKEPALYAGGQFGAVGASVARGIAKWTPAGWTGVGESNGLSNPVSALCRGDGSDQRVFAGGRFRTAGSSVVNGIAVWDGTRWAPLKEGIDGSRYVPEIRTLLMRTGALYAGGTFATAGTIEAANIARWTGTQWRSLGSGVDETVWALCWQDDNGGSLYAGGDFSRAGGVDAKCIARWDGERWHTLGAGMSNVARPKVRLARGGDPHLERDIEPPLSVRALQVFDDGQGSAVFAGGMFDRAGDVEANA